MWVVAVNVHSAPLALQLTSFPFSNIKELSLFAKWRRKKKCVLTVKTDVGMHPEQ